MVHTAPMLCLYEGKKKYLPAEEEPSLEEVHWDTWPVPMNQSLNSWWCSLCSASKKQVRANYTLIVCNDPVCESLFAPFLQKKYLRKVGRGTNGSHYSKVAQTVGHTGPTFFSAVNYFLAFGFVLLQ